MRISLRLLGHCLGLVQGDQRTLAANLGAAAQYQLADRDSLNLNLGQATVVYVEGFFLSHSPEVVMEIARFCQAEKMMFVFNLCGEYVCQDLDYCRNVIKLLPFIKFLFGNKNEYDVFIKTVSLLDLKDDVKQCVDKLIEGAASSDEENLQLVEDCDIEEEHQFCIVTNSNQPVHCFAISNHSYSCSVTVPDLPRELIKAGSKLN